MAQYITVLPYDPAWEAAFQREKALLREILGENCLEIYHIGSTAVPDLAAKPVIDLMPVVTRLEEVDGASRALEDAGYEYLGEFGIPGRRYLRKGGDLRTHQVHIFAATDQNNIRRHLAFRDYMRAHPQAREVYAQLKKDLALRFPYDIEGYCNGKDTFVQAVQAEALAWAGSLEDSGPSQK